MFLLRRTVSLLLLPQFVSFLLLGLGIALLLFTKRQRAGKAAVLGGFLVFGFSGCDPIANLLLRPLEGAYEPLFHTADGEREAAARKVKHIVVLGSGCIVDDRVPITSRLDDAGAARLMEAMRIHRHVPAAKLVLSGGIPRAAPYALVAATFVESVGVAKKDLIVNAKARDTEEEAREMRALLGNERFVLVTSAAHLPRAMALFRKQGLDPIAAPADFWTLGTSGPPPVIPTLAAVRKTQRALHEYVGRLWSTLRGRA